MQIVIDINENDYKTLMINGGNCSVSMAERIVESVYQGKKLPKGHGRLIDVNELLDDIGLEDNGYNRDVNAGEIITLENVDRITTIIEADEEETDADSY